MKKHLIALLGITIFFISHSIAQDTKPAKGYYSISGKKEQLPANANPVSVQSGTGDFPSVTKGYYSISGNEKKLRPALRIYMLPKGRVASKGYYSIPRKL